MRWADDLTEAVVRYGWTVAWERPWPRPGETESSSAVSHEPPTALRYVPDGRLLTREPDDEEPHEAPSAWILDRQGMKTLYLPPYLDSLVQVEAQWARFPSATGVTILAAAEDRVGEGRAVGLFATTGTEEVTRGSGGAVPGRVWGSVRVPAGTDEAARSALVSLEAIRPSERQGQRSRVVLGLKRFPPDVLTLSDVVLMDRGPEPGSLDEVGPRMRGGAEVGPVDTLAVAFQVAGLGPRQEALSFRVWVERAEEGVFSRLAGWIGLGGDQEPLDVAWTESAPAGERAILRSVEVVLPDLEPGFWDLAVGVQAPGRFEAVRKRRIRVQGS